MLEEQPDVSVAMPFSDIGVVEVWTNKKGALTESTVREVVEKNKKFTMVSFSKQPSKPTSRTATGKRSGK